METNSLAQVTLTKCPHDTFIVDPISWPTVASVLSNYSAIFLADTVDEANCFSNTELMRYFIHDENIISKFRNSGNLIYEFGF